MKIKMTKRTPDGQQTVEAHFRSITMTTTNQNTIDEDYDKAIEKIKRSILEYQRMGSGWFN